MSNRRHIPGSENIYSSACIQALEQEYCSSCSAAVVSSCLVSSHGFGARMVSRIYNGGRQAVYTATVGAMLMQNMAMPAYGGTVPAGQTSSGLIVSGNDTLYVYGKTIGTQIRGTERICSGGIAEESVVSYAFQVVESGGTANSTTFHVGGYQYIYSGGVANDTYFREGTTWGDQFVFGGTANRTVATSGGGIYVYSGTGNNAQIYSSGYAIVSSAGRMNDTAVYSGGVFHVRSGGIASNTEVHSGGRQVISSGGKAYHTVQSSGGNVDVVVIKGNTKTYLNGTNERGESLLLSSGIASNFIVNSGGMHTVSSGGKSYNLVQNSGGNINVSVIANDTNTYVSGVNENGETMLLENGVASNFVLNSGAVHTITSGGKSYNVVQKDGATLNVTVTGSDGDTYVSGTNAYGETILLESGIARNFIVNSNGSQVISSGGMAYDTTVKGTQIVSAGGSAIRTELSQYGNQTLNGGSAISTHISSWASQTVSAGGVASDTVVDSGATQIISAGGKAYNTTRHSGGNLQTVIAGDMETYVDGIDENGSHFVLESGVGSNFVIRGGDRQSVVSGGVVSNIQVQDGGVQVISSGGITKNTVLKTSGMQAVDNASAYDTLVLDQGQQSVYSNGQVYNTIVESGGMLDVNSNGKAYNVTQHSGGNVNMWVTGTDLNTHIDGTNERGESFLLESGIASNFIVNSSGYQSVSAGGVAYDTTVNSGGTQHIAQGGKAYNTIQNSGGNITVYTSINDWDTYVSGTNERGESFLWESGIASNFIINSNGYQGISNGMSAYDTIINSGGNLSVSTGGTVYNTTVSSGGALNVNSGGKASGVIQQTGANINGVVTGWDNTTYVSGINENGETLLLSGGVASNFIINSGGRQTVSSGGIARQTTVNSGGTQYIAQGGKAYNVVQNSGANIFVPVVGGDNSTYVSGINENGETFVLSNGIASNFVFNGGGRQDVSSGGSAKNTTINSGTWQLVTSASVEDTVINSGGSQWITSGAVAHDTVINSGGIQEISNGGKSLDVIQNSGGNIDVYVAGNDVSTYVSGTNQRGESFVFENGIASNFIVNSGGRQLIQNDGLAIDTTILSGAYQWVTYGSAQHAFIAEQGSQIIGSKGVANDTILNGSQIISSGGYAYDTVVNERGEQIISSGAQAIDTEINNGGSQVIEQLGQAVSTIINSGGTQIVNRGGLAESTTITSAGSQIIETGGIANSTILKEGGEQYVRYGGRANSTAIEAGGSQIVDNGGIVDGAVIYNSGTQEVSSGGTVSSSVISAGGIVLVENGGTTIDITINNGGTEEIVSGGIANGTTVNSGGEQVISSGGIANGTTLNSGGEQAISSGGVANSTIINSDGKQYVFEGGLASNTTINAGGDQHLSSGAVASNTTIYYDADQIISAGAIAKDTIVYDYGFQNVSSGGIASNTTVNSGGYQEIYKGGTATDATVNSGGLQNISSGGLATNTTLNNGTVNLYAGGTMSGLTAAGGALNVYGNNTLQGNITLANAHVNIQHASGMNTLGIQNLSANNAVFNMNVDLVEQTGDKLSITDTYSGNANLKLTNVAATAKETTGDGIKLVEFGSAATVNGTFDLVGGQWDEGGYIYKLQQGTQAGEGSDYYLRSTGVLTDTFKTMLNIPVMNAMIAQTGMNSLQRRLGDLRAMNNLDAKQGVWVRSYYKDMTVKDLAKTDMSLFGAEAGYDWLFRADEPTKLYAGVLVGFVSANSIKTENNKGMYDKGDGEAPGVGVYATLINESGWFVDIAARNFWSKLDMKNHSSDGTELAYKPSRNVFAASIEAGKSFNTELARNRFIRIEPKVEVGYMNAASSTTDVANTTNQIKYDATNYINAKAGVLLSYNAIRSNGLLIEPLLELAYRYEFDGKGNVSYGGAKAESDLSGGTAEINAGLNMQLTDNLYWYGLGSYEASNKVKGWGVHAGIRYAFGGKKVVKPKKVKQVKTKQPKLIKQEPVEVMIPAKQEPIAPVIAVQPELELPTVSQEVAVPEVVETIAVEQPQPQQPAMASFDEEVPREIENGQVKPLERSMVAKEDSSKIKTQRVSKNVQSKPQYKQPK